MHRESAIIEIIGSGGIGITLRANNTHKIKNKGISPGEKGTNFGL